jgi:hypothetical protein
VVGGMALKYRVNGSTKTILLFSMNIPFVFQKKKKNWANHDLKMDDGSILSAKI